MAELNLLVEEAHLLRDDGARFSSLAPVFVLGCAWRCGSTLLQRLLSSTGELLVWGEHCGLVADLVGSRERLEEIQPLAERQRRNFLSRGSAAWVANLNPSIEPFFPEALRAFLTAYYGRETERLGYRRWGFKEVRYDYKVARELLRAFPGGRVLFLIRPLAEVLASNAANDWYSSVGGPPGVTDRWIANVGSFLENSDDRILHVQYSDLAEGNGSAIEKICRHAGLDVAVDIALLREKVRAADSPPRLTELELDQLRREDVRNLSERLAIGRDYARRAGQAIEMPPQTQNAVLASMWAATNPVSV